jgi:hypothetical protein
MDSQPRMARAHSSAVAEEYKRLGWTLVQEIRAEPGKPPSEYYFEWKHEGPPCHFDFESFEKRSNNNSCKISGNCMFACGTH